MDNRVAVLARVARTLAVRGWVVTDLTANTKTGFARLVVENHQSNRMITLLRSSYRSQVVERRDLTAEVPGMYRSFREVVDHIGGRTHEDLASALRVVGEYVSDNADALSAAVQDALR